MLHVPEQVIAAEDGVEDGDNRRAHGADSKGDGQFFEAVHCFVTIAYRLLIIRLPWNPSRWTRPITLSFPSVLKLQRWADALLMPSRNDISGNRIDPTSGAVAGARAMSRTILPLMVM